MKRLTLLAALVDEVIPMSRSGVSDCAIIAYVPHPGGRFHVTADDIIAMNDVRVSPRLIRAMIDESRSRTEPDETRAYVRPLLDHDPTPP